MINSVSDKWKQNQLKTLVSEGFVEISYLVSEDGLQDEATASSTSEIGFSDIENIVDTVNTYPQKKWITNELNLWMLDGSMNVLPSGTQENIGYVSENFNGGNVSIAVEQVHTHPLQGITITWSEEFQEYATKFTVTAYNGSRIVAQKTVNDNTDVISQVYIDMVDYDGVGIEVHEWCLPDKRIRIEKVVLGVQQIFTKKDLLKYSHNQTGCVMSGKLPNNSITFSLDNSNGKWNLNNPQGIEKYLTEKQKITVRYGYDIDGSTEWIKAGTFYLTEWRNPTNGIEVTFSARDILCYMMEEIYTGITTGTLYEIASAAIEQADLPSGIIVNLDERLKNYTATVDKEYKLAEILQLCANAACCVMYQDRDGMFWIKYRNEPVGSYRIGTNISYSYPEFELSKQLKAVQINYGDRQTYLYTVADIGEIQTVSNPFIATEEQASVVAKWVANNLKFRKKISGEYRADPRLDVFDRVGVESKYGFNNATIIDEISYTYSGVFRGKFSGVITEFKPVAAAMTGEIYVGEV